MLSRPHFTDEETEGQERAQSPPAFRSWEGGEEGQGEDLKSESAKSEFPRGSKIVAPAGWSLWESGVEPEETALFVMVRGH